MWELLGTLIEGAIEFIEDLLEDDADATALPNPNSPAEIAGGIGPMETAAGPGTNYTAAMDGGYSPDRFDPKPPDGPYSP